MNLQLGTNIAANSVSAGCDLTALFPRFINIRRGGYVAALVGLVMCPWNLLKDSNSFTSYLSAYSVFLSSIAGVMVGARSITLSSRTLIAHHVRSLSIGLSAVVTTALPIFTILAEMDGIGTPLVSTGVLIRPISAVSLSTSLASLELVSFVAGITLKACH